jgi:hypothetical protein
MSSTWKALVSALGARDSAGGPEGLAAFDGLAGIDGLGDAAAAQPPRRTPIRSITDEPVPADRSRFSCISSSLSNGVLAGLEGEPGNVGIDG